MLEADQSVPHLNCTQWWYVLVFGRDKPSCPDCSRLSASTPGPD